MQGEMAQAANKAFRQLLDADMKFGAIANERGQQVELSSTTFMQFAWPEHEVRKTAFHQYYAQFRGTKIPWPPHSLVRSIKTCTARVRKYDSALAGALFPDNVPQAVYDNLIAAVRKHLPAVHRYYDVRRRKMNLPDIHHYDTYVPILSDLEVRRTWDEAVSLVMESLRPLGEEYIRALEAGLRGRWCDRYPNQGKQSGGFLAAAVLTEFLISS